MTPPDQSRDIAQWADTWHQDLVKFLVRRRVALADAQDLAQEVYLRLLRVDHADLVRQPRSYLLRIAANLLHEWRLKARQSRPHDAPVDGLAGDGNPEQDVVDGERAQRLGREMNRLTAPVRLALVLQIREGLTYGQIAARMKVTPRMVKRYLLTAYATLRMRLPRDL